MNDSMGDGSSAAPRPHHRDWAVRDLTEPTTPWSGAAGIGASPVWQDIRREAPHYRLLGPLGIGGMGVVYRAQDTRLGRNVALKFLPPALTPNPTDKMRFLQEARAAALLDHPNVCTVFEIGETAGGQLYLAMACYDGETLKARLERGPMSVREAVRIAVQAARGLAEAHRHGIVHRDVKPANLMITADGTVKILDFGIAQLPGPSGPVSARPLLGTPAYMSPEQARGEVVDARSDLWSLGIVLYEMLAGRRPAPQAVRTAVEPALQPLGRLRPDVPPALRRILARLLCVAPAERYPDASALLLELVALENGIAFAGARLVAGRSGKRLRVLLVMLAAAALVASGAYILVAAGHRPGAARRLGQGTYTRLTDLPGKEEFPNLAPDGRFFLYQKLVDGRSHIFLQRVGGSNPQDLSRASPADDAQPAFSPDGQRIAFRSERDGGGIFIMGATGESVVRLTDFGFNPAWSPDGQEIVCGTDSSVHPSTRHHLSAVVRVNLATGKRRLVRGKDAAQPSWSPHGYRIAYWGIDNGRRIVWTMAADGSRPVRVTDGGSLDWNPTWSPDGHYLYFASDRSGVMNLWRVAIDEASGRVLGESEPVTVSAQPIMQYGGSPGGKQFVFAGEDMRTMIERVGFAAAAGRIAGNVTTIRETAESVSSCDVSPDGNWLLYQAFMPRETISLIHPDGTGLRQLVGGGSRNRSPRWSPDSSRVAFYSARGGNYEIWTVRADGSELAPATAFHAPENYHPIWSPDGRRLACDLGGNEALVDLERPLAERRPDSLPPAGPKLGFSASSWSADGRWLAGVVHRSNEKNLPGIVLYSVTDHSYVRLTARGGAPCWLADARRLLYMDDGDIYLVDSRTRSTRRILAAPAGSYYDDICVGPGDRMLYLVRPKAEGDIWLFTQK